MMSLFKTICVLVFIIFFGIIDSEAQGLCDHKAFGNDGFELSSTDICLPGVLNIKDKSGNDHVKYVYDYQGENLESILLTATKQLSFIYTDIGKPKNYTILQVGEKKGKVEISCKNVNVRANNEPIYSYTVCDSLVEFNIPLHKVNNFDTYKIEFGSGISLVNIQSTQLPYSFRRVVSLPYIFKISGNYTDPSKNCSNTSSAKVIPSKSIITALPYSPNIEKVELLDLKRVKLDYTGPYVNDPSSGPVLYRYEKNNFSTIQEIQKGIVSGQYEFSIPDSSKAYCFYVKRKSICGKEDEESAEICTHPIKKLSFNPNFMQNELSWDQYPTRFKGLTLLPFPLAILNGISFNTSQVLKIIVENLNPSSIMLSSSTFNYFHKSVDCRKKYCYQTEQVISGTYKYVSYYGRSISNKVCIDQSQTILPPITNLLVTTNKHNYVYVEDDKSWPLRKENWFLYKQTGSNFTKIDSTSNIALGLKDSSILSKSENYKVGFVDQCNSRSALSDSVSSVFLNLQGQNTINWTPGNPFSADSIEGYELFLKDEKTKVQLIVEELDSSKRKTEVDLGPYEEFATFYLKAKASGQLINKFSNSNDILLPISPVIYLPNVFTPNKDGENDILKINGKVLMFKDFQMQIFNRFGEIVANFNDVNDTWDGVYKNNEVVSGLYIYKVSGILKNGEKFSKAGVLEIMR